MVTCHVAFALVKMVLLRLKCVLALLFSAFFTSNTAITRSLYIRVEVCCVTRPHWKHFRHMHETPDVVVIVARIGVETYLIPPGDLHEVAPDVWAEDILLAAYEPHSGYADPTATTLSLLDAARRLGVQLRQQAEVLEFVTQGERVVGVKTSVGEIEAGKGVCAGGGGGPGVLAETGLEGSRVEPCAPADRVSSPSAAATAPP